MRINEPRFRIRRMRDQKLSDELLTTLTILLSILVFVIAPLQANGVIAGRYFGLIFAAVLIPAAFMLAANWYAAGAMVLAILLIAVASEMEFRDSTIVDVYLDAVAWLIAGLTLSSVVARAVFGPGKVTFHRILGGVLLYLTIGLTFVALFGLISLNVPDAFKGLEPLRGNYFAVAGNLIYFSFVTLTTIGYGDIVPLHPYARGLANLEAVIGQLYPATLLARLVTLEITSAKSP
jgi:voltage-gated potassium channel Kch